MLYMFRTILVHHQEQLLKAVHRIWYMPVLYVWLLCGYSHTTARHIRIKQIRCTAYIKNVAPDDCLIKKSETCRVPNEK